MKWLHPQASLQVALHVTMRPNGAKASNRVSVSGGVSGRDDSQEALSDAADGATLGTSLSTPGVVGKANSKRVVQSQSRDAGALQTSKREKFPHFASFASMRQNFVVIVALIVAINFNGRMEKAEMRIIQTSVVDGRVEVALQASLQVALHVTMRQNGAKASNRVSVSGGVSGRDDSQEALSDAADGGLYPLVREVQHQRLT
ncbi:hypothetical protein ACO0LO_16295 [Undibacterium sp. TJN25]|uniref:hypothetical protein n=1 Tax=Undibacterium sp. TJN25 TaxID=3413056 RepID=UPI003BF1EE9A